eukprot:TRINITY_DN245564_c0_g1_i1.p1 TRINITY_DN245564_c0_g1~~TRINITY_DN245564_c0_g1_i1.p1  ORF type:complete len:188 (-),score=17.82 TRINITY_DN245564_c0_g1_i1:88-651(-)
MEFSFLRQQQNAKKSKVVAQLPTKAKPMKVKVIKESKLISETLPTKPSRLKEVADDLTRKLDSLNNKIQEKYGIEKSEFPKGCLLKISALSFRVGVLSSRGSQVYIFSDRLEWLQVTNCKEIKMKMYFSDMQNIKCSGARFIFKIAKKLKQFPDSYKFQKPSHQIEIETISHQCALSIKRITNKHCL